MDSLPTETRPAIHLKEHYEENPRKFISREPRFTGNKTESGSLSSNTLKQPKVESSLNHDNHYSNPSTKSLSSVKPLRREHPQEELLQKFKKDFEAWQASKAWGFSSNLDQNEIGQQQKDEHVLAMQNFDMEKRERFLSSERFQVQKKPKEIEAYASVNKQDGNLSEQCMPRTKDDVTMKKKLLASSLDPVSKSSFHEKISRSCSPARIVILKPTTDMKEEMNESWRGSSEVLGKGSSMEDFLEEVKERLRLEMEGKGRKESIKRGVGTHASLHERPADPKQLARDVAKHMRESARDFGAPMMRSESTKIYMDDFNLKEKEVFEAMKRETRKLIPHMMKNVVKDDYDDNNEKDKSNDQRVGNSLLQDNERTASNSVLSKVGKGASFFGRMGKLRMKQSPNM
ncbi:hypothetical protein HPP92_022688 [Vanilla planifolia]|uniref:Uncharacterized protein n=1 Tax=Vanilla planifolia TaxID=51239 RepID=A0A835PSG3_VANPL|nr:hypothetical protein HPP92_022688 [Vanilla planifolia]